MSLAFDRVTKSTYVEFHDSPGKMEGAAFLCSVIQAFPYQMRIVLTDNGAACIRNASTKWDTMRHIFDRVCDEHGIEHRLTKPYHPWTNGQAERMNQALCAHVLAFVSARSFAKHLKAFRLRTPFQTIRDDWKADPNPSRSTRTTSYRDQTPNPLLSTDMMRHHNLVTQHPDRVAW